MSHYNGSAESELRIAVAIHKLINLFYKNETIFNFDPFSKNLKVTFDNMEKYGKGISDKEKVSTFLDKICTMNHKLKSTITLFSPNHNGNYLTAKKYRVTQIRFIF